MDSLTEESSQSTRIHAEMIGWNKPLPEKLPRPTYWPFILALGVMMMAMGVVTNIAVTIVGFLLFVVAVSGWIGEIQHGE